MEADDDHAATETLGVARGSEERRLTRNRKKAQYGHEDVPRCGKTEADRKHYGRRGYSRVHDNRLFFARDGVLARGSNIRKCRKKQDAFAKETSKRQRDGSNWPGTSYGMW